MIFKFVSRGKIRRLEEEINRRRKRRVKFILFFIYRLESFEEEDRGRV